MKSSTRLLTAVAAAAAALFSTQALHAESSYGYSNTAAAASASADLNVTVTVPKVVLLRVGSSNAQVDTVTIGLTPSLNGTELSPLNDQNIAWDGTTLPTFAATAGSVGAAAWTNAPSAELTQVTTVPAGFTADLITVNTTAPGTGAALTHPGTDLGTSTPTSLTGNQLYTSIWNYTIDGTAAAALPAGDYTSTVVYTASTI